MNEFECKCGRAFERRLYREASCHEEQKDPNLYPQFTIKRDDRKTKLDGEMEDYE